MAKKQSNSSKTPLARQDDPTTPIDSAAFLAATRPVLKALQADLLARADGSPSVVTALRARWEMETEARRTADVFEVWRRNLVAQVAAAWLLSVVFVRMLEDRGLLDRNRVAGPGALDSQQQFLQLAPYLSERDYLLETFRELTRIPAAAAMFDARHSLVWLLAPSAEGAKALLALFRAPDADAPSFRFGQSDTRFLGDLYQDLDEDVRARYALLQTPHFIESFVLDRTLERSIEEFGLDATTLIDPTCGSGHFLLGAFERLFERRMVATPGLDPREAVRLALDAVHGVDINPYSIAIARVRLTLAALEKGRYAKLKTAPVLPLNLVVADSLLHRVGEGQASFGDARGQSAQVWKGEPFALEDEEAAKELLAKRFAVVVGNPPYITVKDAALRDSYRRLYPLSAGGQYSLAAPFTERFFGLATPRGFVGMITANSFMKREFGKKLIEEYLPTVDVEYVVNTSGAFIPGHGTPTVLIFGRHAPPAGQILAVLAKRGEPSTPQQPESGLVWRSIADHWNDVGFENDYVSVARLERTTLNRHPWSLGGGGAAELKELLEQRSPQRLGQMVLSMGRVAHTGADEAFVAPANALLRSGLSPRHIAEFVEGDRLRDWSLAEPTSVVFPYDAPEWQRCGEDGGDARLRWLWPFRTGLWLRREPNGTHREIGLTWYEFSRFHPERFAPGLSIAFAFVATHNHFVLDRGGKVFKQSAPIIKLPDGATEDDHLALLAYLNSSTACFYFRQVLHSKGAQGVNEGHKAEEWEQFLEFSGTQVAKIPLPPDWQTLSRLGRELVELSVDRANASPEAAVERKLKLGAPLTALSTEQARREEEDILERMVAKQEEIDFEVYRLFGLVSQSNDAGAYAERGIEPGSRPFEVQLVRDGIRTSWFSRHGYPTPGVEKRALSDLSLSADVLILEQPVYKRRWLHTDWAAGVEAARRARTLAALEDYFVGHGEPRVETAATIVRPALRIVPTVDSDGETKVGRWAADAAVPFLASYRQTELGLEKRASWERVWELQRREDAGATVGTVPVPPKYDSKDYRDQITWTLRGKLDVPKERFISYPGCESDQDKSPVYGWAGWNHLQQAQALAALYLNRKNEEGWKADRLVPMLAGILELLPWVKQWHNEPNADFGGERLGDYFARFVDDECRSLAVSHDDLRAWRPATKASKRSAARAAATDDAEASAPAAEPKKPRKPRKKTAASSAADDEGAT